MAAKGGRVKFTPFPKKKSPHAGGGRPVIDIEKMRDQYVNGKDYSWAEFCRTHNYNPTRQSDLTRPGNGYNWLEWKAEWQKRQLNIYDEELTPELLTTTAIVTRQRCNFVKDWGKRSRYLKTLFDAMIERHGRDFTHDQQNMLAIQAGKVRPRFALDPAEMQTIATAAQRLQELELRSLLVVSDPEKIRKLESAREDDADEIPEPEIATIGKQMNGPETIQLMASYFDQFQGQAQLGEAIKDQNLEKNPV